MARIALLAALLPGLALGFDSELRIEGSLDGSGVETVVPVSAAGTLDGTSYILRWCVEDVHGPERCSGPLEAVIPPIAPPPDPDPDPDPTPSVCRDYQDDKDGITPLPPMPAGHNCIAPPVNSAAVDIDFAAHAAALAPGEWARISDFIVLEQHDVVLSKPSNLAPDYNRLAALWGTTQDHALKMGKNTLYPITGESSCPFNYTMRAWGCHSSGHGDGLINTFYIITLEPAQVRRIWGPDYVPDHRRIPDVACTYPRANVMHPGHDWGGSTWDEATGTFYVRHNQTGQNGGGQCPQFLPAAFQDWSWSEAGGLVNEGSHDNSQRNQTFVPGVGLVRFGGTSVVNGKYIAEMDKIVAVIGQGVGGNVQIRDPRTGLVEKSFPITGLVGVKNSGLRHSGWDVREVDGRFELWLVTRESQQLWNLDLSSTDVCSGCGTHPAWTLVESPLPYHVGGRLWNRAMVWIEEWGVFVSMQPFQGFLLYKPL